LRQFSFFYFGLSDQRFRMCVRDHAVETTGDVGPVCIEEAKFREYELYPLLATYLKAELGVYSKRIDGKRSSNRC
jgi:hypothetical protein